MLANAKKVAAFWLDGLKLPLENHPIQRQSMRILITGGAGFIGSHLAEALVSEGNKVRVIDNFSSGKTANLEHLNVEIIEGDVADFTIVQGAVDGCNLVFHQAALVSVPLSITNPLLNHQSNVTGTANVFEAARQAGVRRVVYASSAAVYGNAPSLPKRESDRPDPVSPYAAAKLSGELQAAAYFHSFGLETVGLRYFNVFGPRQDPSSPYSGVLSIFCQAALNQGQVTVHGDGNQTRDFVFVSDVVRANLKAAQVDFERLERPTVFNIGRGEQTSLNQVLDFLVKIRGQPLAVEYGSPRAGDIRHSVADISAARTHLGFEPQISVEEGLQQTLDSISGKR